MHILQQKLDNETYKEYKGKLENPKEPQELKTFLEFLGHRVVHLEAIENNFKRSGFNKYKTNQNPNKKGYDKEVDSRKCIICEEAHETKGSYKKG